MIVRKPTLTHTDLSTVQIIGIAMIIIVEKLSQKIDAIRIIPSAS